MRQNDRRQHTIHNNRGKERERGRETQRVVKNRLGPRDNSIKAQQQQQQQLQNGPKAESRCRLKIKRKKEKNMRKGCKKKEEESHDLTARLQ